MARSRAKFLFKIVIRRQKPGDKQEEKGQCSKDTAAAKDSDFKAVLTKSLFAYLFIPARSQTSHAQQIGEEGHLIG